MDLIPKSMAKALREDIQYNSKVVKISHKNSKSVQVTFDCKGQIWVNYKKLNLINFV